MLSLEAYHNSSTPVEILGTYADGGGANMRTVIAANGMKVGIGTDNPAQTLTIFGASSSGLRISKAGVLAYDHTFDGSTYEIKNNNGSAGIPLIIGTKTSGGESLRITSGGEVVTQGLTGATFDNDGANTKIVEITGDGTVGEYGQINISGNQDADNSTVGVIKFINRENTASSSGSNAGSRQLGSIEMRVSTDDSNAHHDSGGYFRVITKSAEGGNAERLRITSTNKFGFGGVTPGGTPANKNVFLAIGDSDTGIVQDGDGQLEIWGNAVEVANFNAIDGYTSTKRIYTTGTGRFGQTRINSISESSDNAFNDLIIGDNSGNRGIQILSANGSHSTLGFGKSGALSDGYIQYQHNSTATSSWMRVKSSGQIILNTAGTDRITVRAGSGATNDKIQINQSNGGFYHTHHSASITPSDGDWVYFGYVAYGGSQRGQFVVEWSSLNAPSCCYHGYAILEAGSSHGPDYDYAHSESIELISYDSHGAHNFKAWKLVDSSSSSGSHLKIMGQWSGSTVQSGTFHMTVLPSKTMFGQTIIGATPAVDNNSYNGTRLTIDGRLQRGSTGFAPAQLRLNKSMFGIFHASRGLDTAGPVTTRGIAAGADGTIWCNYGGLSATRNSNIVGSYTPFSGMVAPCGAGARYLHVKFNITGGSMWLVDIKGYEYNGLWTSTVNGSSVSNDHVLHAIAGGYHYNNNALFNGKSAAYRGANPGWYLHGGYICCWIDTNNTGTGNRWGFYKFEGGVDGIIGANQQKPACVLAYTYSTGTGSAF